MKAVLGAGDNAVETPLSERLCDISCVVFALWTVCCHLVVAAGVSLRFLVILFAVVAVAATVVAVRGRGFETTVPGPAPIPQAAGSAAWRGQAQLWGGIFGLAGALAIYRSGSAVLFWLWTVGLIGLAALVFVLGTEPREEAPRRGPRLEMGLWILVLVCVVITLVAHRSDPDDAFYVNAAVSAADQPDRTLWSGDRLHGIEGLPMHQPAYRVHSFELASGALAFVTGIPAIYCFHFILASLAAALVPLAHARLFRLLTPDRWLWTTAALIWVLVVVGETHRWYGNYAFVRMYQGKGSMLYIFLPLVFVYGMKFALRPSWRLWGLLGAAQIAAIGTSSTAIWAAPACALMALSCAVRPSLWGVKTFLLGALASGYVIAAGLVVKLRLKDVMQIPRTADGPVANLDQALATVLGEADLRAFGILVILVAWACCRRGLAQRFAIVVPLAVAVVLLNPWWSELVRANVTGPSYWRAMWILPIPILMTWVLTSPLAWADKLGRRNSAVASAVALMVFALAVPSYGGLSESNKVRLAVPGLKTPPSTYTIAKDLHESVPAGSYVVAPEAVSLWVPTFHDHAYPLQVRFYLRRMGDKIDPQSLHERFVMTDFVEGKRDTPDAAEIFRRGLFRYRVAGVCLRVNRAVEEARAILTETGFQRAVVRTGYEVWTTDRYVPERPAPRELTKGRG